MENITVEQFFKSSSVDEYKILFNALKEKNVFNNVVCDFYNLKYIEILLLQDLLINPTIEGYLKIYEICYKQQPKAFLKANIVDFAHSNRYIINELKRLKHREGQLLEVEPDPKFIQAGGERLNVFGEKSVLIQLAEQFGKSPSEIGEWSYNEVFMIRYWNSTTHSINKAMMKIK